MSSVLIAWSSRSSRTSRTTLSPRKTPYLNFQNDDPFSTIPGRKNDFEHYFVTNFTSNEILHFSIFNIFDRIPTPRVSQQRPPRQLLSRRLNTFPSQSLPRRNITVTALTQWAPGPLLTSSTININLLASLKPLRKVS